jgi:hypothetical protein
MFEKRVASLAEPKAAIGVDIGREHIVVPAKTRLGCREIELRHDVQGDAQGTRNATDIAAQAS